MIDDDCGGQEFGTSISSLFFLLDPRGKCNGLGEALGLGFQLFSHVFHGRCSKCMQLSGIKRTEHLRCDHGFASEQRRLLRTGRA